MRLFFAEHDRSSGTWRDRPSLSTVGRSGEPSRALVSKVRFISCTAWATEKRILLAQAATEGAGSELPAALKLLCRRPFDEQGQAERSSEEEARNVE